MVASTGAQHLFFESCLGAAVMERFSAQLQRAHWIGSESDLSDPRIVEIGECFQIGECIEIASVLNYKT